MFAISTSVSSAAKNFDWQNVSDFLAVEDARMTKTIYADKVGGSKILGSDIHLSQMSTG